MRVWKFNPAKIQKLSTPNYTISQTGITLIQELLLLSLVCLFVVCLFVFTSDNHLRPPFASTFQAYPLYNQAKKGNQYSSFSCKHQSYVYLTSRVQATSIHPSHTAEKLRLMGSVSKTHCTLSAHWALTKDRLRHLRGRTATCWHELVLCPSAVSLSL